MNREQTILYEHEAFVEDLIARINRLIVMDHCTTPDPRRIVTKFGWVLAGNTHGSISPPTQYITHHTTVLSGDDVLRKFWELEEPPSELVLSVEERAVVQHFKENHFRLTDGRFAVPLPKRDDAPRIGESHSQAVRRFLSLERSLHTKGQFSAFANVVEEYFSLCHAEEIPVTDLQKPPHDVFYLPMHAVHKQSSTITKLRIAFNASAKSSTGTSLNDTDGQTYSTLSTTRRTSQILLSCSCYHSRH